MILILQLNYSCPIEHCGYFVFDVIFELLDLLFTSMLKSCEVEAEGVGKEEKGDSEEGVRLREDCGH